MKVLYKELFKYNLIVMNDIRLNLLLGIYICSLLIISCLMINNILFSFLMMIILLFAGIVYGFRCKLKIVNELEIQRNRIKEFLK